MLLSFVKYALKREYISLFRDIYSYGLQCIKVFNNNLSCSLLDAKALLKLYVKNDTYSPSLAEVWGMLNNNKSIYLEVLFIYREN